jgi:hypothetical protein
VHLLLREQLLQLLQQRALGCASSPHTGASLQESCRSPHVKMQQQSSRNTCRDTLHVLNLSHQALASYWNKLKMPATHLECICCCGNSSCSCCTSRLFLRIAQVSHGLNISHQAYATKQNKRNQPAPTLSASAAAGTAPAAAAPAGSWLCQSPTHRCQFVRTEQITTCESAASLQQKSMQRHLHVHVLNLSHQALASY